MTRKTGLYQYVDKKTTHENSWMGCDMNVQRLTGAEKKVFEVQKMNKWNKNYTKIDKKNKEKIIAKKFITID